MTVLEVLSPLIAPVATVLAVCSIVLVFSVLLGKFFGGFLR